ncbi:H-NS family nucleoid-associated regulatory protein [Thauera sp. WH-1]|uniref:H-NS histone family protein n=1 Tax=Thauera sp. WH-1 TaxID=3398230 RepID=UPI0039FC2776
MPTYVELMAQIEALQKQAEEVRQAEIADVIAEIRQKIRDYDLTATDLGLTSVAPLKAESVSRGDKRAAVKPKYRDSASGKTWTGRGVMPKWMKEAVEAGRSRDEFLIPDN